MKYISTLVSSLKILLIILFIQSGPMNISAENGEGKTEGTLPPNLSSKLTAEEIRWIEEHPVMRTGGPKSFPPFHFYDEGLPQGMAAEYIRKCLEDLGIRMEVHGDLLWPEVLDGAKAHEIDIVSCAAKSPEREEYLLFSHPVLSFPLVIISRDDAPFISGIEDLHGMNVGVIEKNAVTDWIRRDGIEIIPHNFNSPKESLEALSLGVVDAYIENLAAASYLITQYGLTNLKIAAPTKYGNYDLFIAVRDDWPEFVLILNKWLAALSPEEHSAIRNRWLSIKYEYGIQLKDVLRIFIIISVFFLAVFSAIMIWNQKLKKEIAIRKKVEAEREVVIRELKAAVASITTLEGLLPICASCKKIRDDKGYWSQIENYFEEHSEVLFSHSLCPECFKELYRNEKWYKERSDPETWQKTHDFKKTMKSSDENDNEPGI